MDLTSERIEAPDCGGDVQPHAAGRPPDAHCEAGLGFITYSARIATKGSTPVARRAGT
jgi:hypothetical protein